jgi:signal peptide peptidase SppA
MSDRPATRVRAAVLAAPWMMTPEMVSTVLSIADRDNATPEAVAAQLGRPLDNTRAVELRGPVAVIPVEGVITRYASIFSEISGGVSIETLATDLRAALDNPAVSAIVLAIDSPGGEANGVGEFAAMVRAADATKPVTAYVGGMAASAGYYIASAAGEIVASPDAILGNIGVIMGVPDPEKRGSRTIDFISSQSPHKRPDPRTEGGRSRLQATVDALADVFIGAVAQYRGITPEAVQAIGGDILVGQAAIDAGLADRLGSFEGVIAQLTEQAREPRRIGPAGRVAAQGTGGIMAEQNLTRWQKFQAWLGGEGDDSAFVPAQIASQGPPPAPASTAPAPVAASAQPDPRVAELQAEIARMKAQEGERARGAIAGLATAFAEGEIRAGRALPAETEALVAAYTEAATDDLDHPRAEGQATRVARLTERQAARPAHALTRELVPVRAAGDGTLTVLDSPAATRAEGDPTPLTPERWRKLYGHTVTGKAILAEHGIPATGELTAAHREALTAVMRQKGLVPA